MESFFYPLPIGGTVTGIRITTLPDKSCVRSRPVVVALHGGMYESHYFDADSEHTASISSTAYGIPFVPIDRPGYGGTSSFLPMLKGTNFITETANWLNQYILPTLRAEIAVPAQCNCIVLFCHSLGAMYGVVTAATHSQEDSIYTSFKHSG